VVTPHHQPTVRTRTAPGSCHCLPQVEGSGRDRAISNTCCGSCHIIQRRHPQPRHTGTPESVQFFKHRDPRHTVITSHKYTSRAARPPPSPPHPVSQPHLSSTYAPRPSLVPPHHHPSSAAACAARCGAVAPAAAASTSLPSEPCCMHLSLAGSHGPAQDLLQLERDRHGASSRASMRRNCMYSRLSDRNPRDSSSN
jgi:hypothetical protein